MDNGQYLQAAVVLGKPPDDSLRSWLGKRCMAAKPRLRKSPRLVNHFKLGADPEFVLEDIATCKRVDAGLLTLRPGAFVGADQNGRLVEVRPEPSRSALHVVASLMQALRLLGPLVPRTLGYCWRAGAWLHDDGIGGHVHFGRKRSTRAAEVMALDGIASALYALRLFPIDQQQRRMQGDRYHQVYGHPSDYRLQIHGYEYRSLPSWLDSPWLAYLCLTLSKLAVVNPDLVAPWSELKAPTTDNLRYLLSLYKGVDDDAALCLYALERLGLPVWNGNDFKLRWGAASAGTKEHAGVNVFPNAVPGSELDIADLYNHLIEGKAIPSRAGTVTWEPARLPEGYELLSSTVDFRGQVGIGELLGNMVRHPHTAPITIYPTHKGKAGLFITNQLAAILCKDWRAKLTEAAPGLDVQITPGRPDVRRDFSIGIHKKWRQGNRFSAIRRALTSGVFPIWKVKEIDPANLLKWEKRDSKQRINYHGTVLFS